VEVIELMPPAVKTAMTTELSEGEGVTLITTDELIKQSFAAFKAGKLEIRPGQSNQLALMRRLAPNFINKQLWKLPGTWFRSGEIERPTGTSINPPFLRTI
jgi:uncharacterized oxidoreductase